jgi:hypothetical protein
MVCAFGTLTTSIAALGLAQSGLEAFWRLF